jgi:hypothetical protein
MRLTANFSGRQARLEQLRSSAKAPLTKELKLILEALKEVRLL